VKNFYRLAAFFIRVQPIMTLKAALADMAGILPPQRGKGRGKFTFLPMSDQLLLRAGAVCSPHGGSLPEAYFPTPV
jgi:hypothetical protein